MAVTTQQVWDLLKRLETRWVALGMEWRADMAQLTEELEDLRNEVRRIPSAVESIKTTITGLMDQIAANAADEATIREITSEVKQNVDTLVAAAIQNTPAEGEPTEPAPGGTEPTA